MLTPRDFHFSITVHSTDVAVLHCLGALSMHAQKEGNKRIPWGGTKQADWLGHHHGATFHFTSPLYRQQFEAEAARLLSKETWSRVGESDDNPAQPQAAKAEWD